VTSENGFAEVAYYDLPERRLALAGATLSRRLENGKGVWRLELPRPSGEPLRVEQLGGPATPPAEVRRLLPAFLRGSGPELVLRLRVHEDEAEVLEGQHSTRTLAIENGETAAAALGLVQEPSEHGDDAIGRLRAMLELQYAQILHHDPGVRLDLDPEDVHGVRVAVRRSRAVLRAARPMLDRAWSEPLRDELKWLGGSLGRRRDADVLVGRLRQQIEKLDQPERSAAGALVELLAEERETAQAIALDALKSDRYYHLLDALEAAARGPRVRRGEVSLDRLARREFERLRKVAEQLGPDASDAALHRARILGKRARYTAELAEPEVGKPARRFVACAKALQDVLGAHQDAIVAEARLRGLLADVPSSGAAFAAGRLVERERARRREARAELPKAWRALKRSARAAWG
jgi:CHAD domain-containing protein